MTRAALIEVDLGAIAHNVRLLCEQAGGAAMCAVVKADAYGHGAVPAAHAALAGGASWLAVALIDEGVELRAAGIGAPILVLSEPPASAMDTVVANGLTPAVYSAEGIDALAAAAADHGRRVAPHLKVDTGMHRVGCRPQDAPDLARRIESHPHLGLGGTFTHFAMADEPGRSTTSTQLARFHLVLDALADAGIDPGLRHAANSAGTLLHPDARLDLVRCGIAVYGAAPAPDVPEARRLVPAMRVVSEVSHVHEVPSGEGVSYGWHHVMAATGRIATVPVGYADGVPRALGLRGGQVLIGGVRCPIVGVVTMDQLMVDVTGLPAVDRGAEAVILGAQGGERIEAWEVARRVDTIAYEVLCGFRLRLARRHVGGPFQSAVR